MPQFVENVSTKPLPLKSSCNVLTVILGSYGIWQLFHMEPSLSKSNVRVGERESAKWLLLLNLKCAL